MSHFMIVLLPYNLLNLSWIKQMSVFEEYRAIKMKKPDKIVH